MSGTPQTRAIEYLKGCAAQIAPSWMQNYESKIPPKVVTDFFDQAVSNVISAEPMLATSFGYAPHQKAELESDLLDIVIRESRLEVRRIQRENSEAERNAQEYHAKMMAKPAAERLEYLRARRDLRLAESTRLAAEAATKQQNEQAKQERLQYLRAKRDAELAELAARQEAREVSFAFSVLELIQQSPYLVTDTGSIIPSQFTTLMAEMVLRIAELWPKHGGQSIDSTLQVFLDRAVKALLQGADPADSSWDIRSDDGTVHRQNSLASLISLHSNTAQSLLIQLAQPHFSYDAIKPWSTQELESELLQLLQARIKFLEAAVGAEATLSAAAESLATWQELHPAPPLSPYGVSPTGAEYWCRDWLEHMGLRSASVTQQSGDGGVDIVSPTHIAQVKHYTGSVSIAELRELVGVSAVDGRDPIFLTSGQFPAQAEEFADLARMLLYQYNVTTGEVVGCTDLSRVTLRSGFLE